jgi:hypothetical protein
MLASAVDKIIRRNGVPGDDNIDGAQSLGEAEVK